MDPPLSLDDLLDFNSDIGEREDEDAPRNPNWSPDRSEFNVVNSGEPCSIPGEEDLEWISNKDAFPSVYTFIDPLTEQSDNTVELNTPISVLENTSTSNNNNDSTSTVSFKVPCKARSKFAQKRRQEISSLPLWINQPTAVRKCQHCGSEKTPQWRAGPLGPKTLCNACGVRFKSGRLVPEYRPANSPSFSHELHSSSHKKVMEMRRKNEENSINFVDKGQVFGA